MKIKVDKTAFVQMLVDKTTLKVDEMKVDEIKVDEIKVDENKSWWK